MKKVLIVASGGLDSTTMALIKKDEGCAINLISFNYGQKALNEIERCKKLAKKLDCQHIILDISSLSFIFGNNNQLTNKNVKIENDFVDSVVVPLRNSIFVNISYIYGLTNQYDEIVLGSHLDDITFDEHGEYMFPDCSPEFFTALNNAFLLGKRKNDHKTIITSASLEGYYKSDLIKKAYQINKDILFQSWSCYENKENQCGKCDSCKNRINAFKTANIIDETKYE